MDREHFWRAIQLVKAGYGHIVNEAGSIDAASDLIARLVRLEARPPASINLNQKMSTPSMIIQSGLISMLR